MDSLGWWIIDAAALLLFLIPACWFGREARRTGDSYAHGASITFGVITTLVLAKIVQYPVL